MVAAIARYHRRSLPKKRHESWQLIEGRDQRRTVSSMALLLCLAVAMDRRPQKVIADCVLKANGENGIAIQLMPLTAEVDLNLERWSLQSCQHYVEEAVGLSLSVS